MTTLQGIESLGGAVARALSLLCSVMQAVEAGVSQGAGRQGGCEQLGVRVLGVVGLYLISVCVVLCVLVQERALDVRDM